jgi:hypothetical protein
VKQDFSQSNVAQMKRYMRFIDWMRSRRQPPSAQEICDFLECGRATAYRWMAAYYQLTGADLE